VKRFQQPGALRVRDDGLRRVRKITWRAELLPELIRLDRWGYPVLASATVPPELEPLARRTVASCPRLALLIERAEPGRTG
jgi:ferredoxin